MEGAVSTGRGQAGQIMLGSGQTGAQQVCMQQWQNQQQVLETTLHAF